MSVIWLPESYITVHFSPPESLTSCAGTITGESVPNAALDTTPADTIVGLPGSKLTPVSSLTLAFTWFDALHTLAV